MSMKHSKNLQSHKLSLSSAKKKEEKEENDENCEAIFLSVFNSLEEEISTVDELMLLLQYAGCNPSKKTMGKYWDESTESYNFGQFCSILKQEGKCSKEDLLKAFLKIDRNGDGFITHEELLQILTKSGERMTKAEVKLMVDDADFNGDGKLDYPEFCSLMEATSKQCQQLYTSNYSKSSNIKSTKSKESMKSNSSSAENMFRDKRNSMKMQEERKSSAIIESKPSSQRKGNGNSISTKVSNQDSLTDSKDKNKEQTRKIIKAEPKDLSKWQFKASKGCFYKEEEGCISSHQFRLKVTQPTTVWITIKSISPKYGKFREGMLDSDTAVFLVEDTSGKLISFSDVEVDEKMCLLADVDIGVYNVLTFSSGIKLYVEESESGKVTLAKGTGDECRLTKSCKDSLTEIFYRCDLDGNGYLSRREFNEFQMRSSGEECDDEAWDVVKESVDLTPHMEITLKGFLDLNLLELRDPDGGQDELWITLDSLGYSNKLLLTKACPFSLEVYTRKGQNELSLLGIGDGGVPLYNAIIESIKMVSNIKPIKNKRDLHLHIATFGKRTSIAVDNQSHSDIQVQIDCSGSENLVSNRGNMDITAELDSKKMSVIHHLLPVNKDMPTKLKYQESIVRS